MIDEKERTRTLTATLGAGAFFFVDHGFLALRGRTQL